MAVGDRLVTPRFVGRGRVGAGGIRYLHHGIDMGDGTVVHARPDDPRRMFAGGRVERTSLQAFADGRSVSIVTEPPAVFPPDEVARRAAAHVGREGYTPIVDNCEHFACWCATGRRESRQADIIAGRLQRVGARVAAVMASRAAGGVGGVGVKTFVGTTVRLGMKTVLPAALLSEGVALAAEFRAHTSGCDERTARAAGERAGLLASVAFFAAGGLAGGPVGMLAGAVTGITMWTAGTAASRILGSRMSTSA